MKRRESDGDETKVKKGDSMGLTRKVDWREQVDKMGYIVMWQSKRGEAGVKE